MNRSLLRAHRWLLALPLAGALVTAAVVGTTVLRAAPQAKHKQPRPEAKEPTQEPKMRDHKPFEIHLSGSGLELRAVLINRSPVAQTVLYHVTLQPSQLNLVGPGGTRIEPFDTRSDKKYDGTVYCRQLSSIAPAGEIEIGTVRFKNTAKGFAANWGPFSFEALPAGEYKSSVMWESLADGCFDEETKQARPLPSVWLGQIVSNEVALRLR
jgi:hypothetical protein